MHDIYPAGNSASGVDGMGVAASADPTQAGRTLTGSGPASWAHSLKPDGILDLIGNCWEYTDGIELQNGVFWLANANNVLENSGVSLDITASTGSAFSYIRNGNKLIECLPTASAGEPVKGSDGCWYNKSGAMLLLRGGDWDNDALDGAFAFLVDNAVSYAGAANRGFRLAFSLAEFDALN